MQGTEPKGTDESSSNRQNQTSAAATNAFDYGMMMMSIRDRVLETNQADVLDAIVNSAGRPRTINPVTQCRLYHPDFTPISTKTYTFPLFRADSIDWDIISVVENDEVLLIDMRVVVEYEGEFSPKKMEWMVMTVALTTKLTRCVIPATGASKMMSYEYVNHAIREAAERKKIVVPGFCLEHPPPTLVYNYLYGDVGNDLAHVEDEEEEESG